MKHKFQIKMIITFSCVFLCLLITLLFSAYLLMDDFYIMSNKRVMYDDVNTFERVVNEEGPKSAAQFLGTNKNHEIMILDQTLNPREREKNVLTMSDHTRLVELKNEMKETEIFEVYDDKMMVLKELRSGDYIYMSKPMGLADESLSLFFQFMTRASVVIYILALVLIIVFSHRISQPIVKLRDKTRDISQLKFGEPIHIGRTDELGELASSVNIMSDKIETAYGNLQSELDEERRLEKMRKQFVANVSHELKNPLAMIQGYAEGLVRKLPKTEEKYDQYYDVIFKESVKMNEIIQDLLDLSAYESGSFILKKESVNLKHLIEDVISSYQIQVNQKSLTVESVLTDVVYSCDRLKMNQVVSNLYSNALKYSEIAGSIILSLNVINDEIIITIKNTGELLSETELASIWHSFYQKHADAEGVGLGLAIVNSIVMLHGGTVKAFVEDQYNCFQVRLNVH